MNRFAIVAAYYYAAERYHSGQWSKGYEILSRCLGKLKFRPSAGLYKDEDIRNHCAALLWKKRREIRKAW